MILLRARAELLSAFRLHGSLGILLVEWRTVKEMGNDLVLAPRQSVDFVKNGAPRSDRSAFNPVTLLF